MMILATHQDWSGEWRLFLAESVVYVVMPQGQPCRLADCRQWLPVDVASVLLRALPSCECGETAGHPKAARCQRCEARAADAYLDAEHALFDAIA